MAQTQTASLGDVRILYPRTGQEYPGAAVHLYLEVIGAGIGMIPLTALTLSYLRNRSPRIALALLGFVALEVRFITMIAIHTVVTVDHATEELVDFGGDLAIMASFAAAFLIGSRWLRERSVGQPA